ncbi:unnamed protein product [Mytilus coruscus]|uniref:Uncharacterized protein n=1 Tax=Mytilus coruscus TaxID=42192 RepID=A0A6J8DSI3_MYTCO|nr:unnamed protein product [Mytilus coruscus]
MGNVFKRREKKPFQWSIPQTQENIRDHYCYQSTESRNTCSSADTLTLNTKGQQLEFSIEMLQKSILQIELVIKEQLHKFVEILEKEDCNVSDTQNRTSLRIRHAKLKTAVVHMTNSLNQIRNALREQHEGLTALIEDRENIDPIEKSSISVFGTHV